jgi:hypothetical protein
MSGSTPDWSALASQNEKVISGGTAQAGDADNGGTTRTESMAQTGVTARAGQRGRHRAATASRHPLWHGRAARLAAAGTAGVLAVTGAAAASAAATPASPSWHIVKRVHDGALGQFTAVTALGSRHGWAFVGENGVTAYKRNGGSWAKVSFPRKPGESVIAARALSSTDAWAFTGGGAASRAVKWNGHTWKAEHTFTGSLTGATVISSRNIWAFFASFLPGGGAYHYNGHSWKHVSSGHGLTGGSASSAGNVWAFDGADVARWTGGTWKRTSVKHLLPKTIPGPLNDPAVVAMWAQSAHSVWALGDGNDEDQGGPVVVLHYNGHSWKKVASASQAVTAGQGSTAFGSMSGDGHGGLWIPIAQGSANPAHLLHYTGGQLKVATLPVPNTKIQLYAVAATGGGGALAAGYTHNTSGGDVVGTILRYGG